jgi:predicted DNA binding CopG/RHH family protein
MNTVYTTKDAKQIQWIKAAVVKVENKKVRLTRRLIEDKLIEIKMEVTYGYIN